MTTHEAKQIITRALEIAKMDLTEEQIDSAADRTVKLLAYGISAKDALLRATFREVVAE